MQLKVFLFGRVAVESDGAVIGDDRFGRQGRLLFAYLVAEHGRPVPHDELAEALWDGARPATWDKALSVVASKLRGLLADGGVLTSAFGCYRLDLPTGSWVDLLATANSVQAAEAALAAGDLATAKDEAAAAHALLREPFLPGEQGEWVQRKRRELDELRVRALDVLADANLQSGVPSEAVKWAKETVTLEPFRETGYRRLMEAHVAAGNPAEALGVYERCRRVLSEELGTYPSAETESIYRALLRAATPDAGAAKRQPPPRPETALLDPPGRALRPPANVRSKRRPGKRAGLVASALLVVAGIAVVLALSSRDNAPPEVLPNSLVRIDPQSLRPTKVVPVGDAPDIVVAAGGYVWVTNHVLRDTDSAALRNAGDRTLTRVDPSTGEAVVVGNGVAPCGLTADPSGDVWVANCYARASGPGANVERIAAKTLKFGPTYRVPGGKGFARGLAYGGGSLWVSGVAGPDLSTRRTLTEVDPRTGLGRSIRLKYPAGPLAWSEGYGDLWMSNFSFGTVSRLRPANGRVQTVPIDATNPAGLVVAGDVVWVSDWAGPRVVRLRAIGASAPQAVPLPVRNPTAGVWCVAAGAAAIWATTPRDGTLWRIDPKTNHVKRIPVPYLPSCVTVDPEGELWLTVRAR